MSMHVICQSTVLGGKYVEDLLDIPETGAIGCTRLNRLRPSMELHLMMHLLDRESRKVAEIH